MMSPFVIDRAVDRQVADLLACLNCGTRLDHSPCCRNCGRAYPEREGIVEAMGALRGTNRIAADFYDGPTWTRFKFWEQVFLWFQGPGIAPARRQVLRHLPDQASLTVLEVGIGDGENVGLLPQGWRVFGVDIARSRLRACLDRAPATAGRLVWAEAEALPFPTATFDAVFSVGGFNYFRDHALALREMRRVAKPGGTLVVADELADLQRISLGRLLGAEWLDRLALKQMGLAEDFVAMVMEQSPDIDAIVQAEWPGSRRTSIWNRLGYCFVFPNPQGGQESWR